MVNYVMQSINSTPRARSAAKKLVARYGSDNDQKDLSKIAREIRNFYKIVISEKKIRK